MAGTRSAGHQEWSQKFDIVMAHLEKLFEGGEPPALLEVILPEVGRVDLAQLPGFGGGRETEA